MKPIITVKAGWGSVKNTVQQPELSYEHLLKFSALKDMRKTSENENKSLAEDYEQACKQSFIPLPGFVDSEDDTSSESYVPHSDWQGPSGESWIGK